MKFLSLFFSLIFLAGGVCRAGYGSQLQSFGFGTTDIVRDNTRDRVYCTVPAQNSVAVIDSDSLQVLATIFTGSQPNALAESADGTQLYVGHLGTTAQGVVVIDLNSLSVVRSIATTNPVHDLAVGNGVVYTVEAAICAYRISDGSAISGSLSTYSGGVDVYGGVLAISPDGKTLYYFQTGLSPSSWYRINVASWPGTTVQSGQFGSNGQGLALSADGQYITFVSGAPYEVNKLQASNPTVSLGQFNTGAYPRGATYSPDGNTLFTNHTSGLIDVWNANTYVETTTLATNSQQFTELQCDRLGKVLFAGNSTALYAYYVGSSGGGGSLNVQINNAVEIRWDSVSGSLYQVQWTGILQGGTWYNLGGQIVGNGLTMSVFDTTRGNQFKFYRVQPVSP
jgi:DNA-binding beta-propeller fold protein YncE